MEIKIDKNAVNTSDEYKEIKGLLKYECHCEWSVKNKFIVIDKSDKTPKDIWESSEVYKEDIKKVGIWFEDFITFLLGWLANYSVSTPNPSKIYPLRIFLCGILPLKKVKFVGCTEMKKLKLEINDEPLKDPFNNKKITRDHIKTEIRIANIFHLMGCYVENEKTIYICPQNIIDTVEVFYRFYNTNNYTREKLYDIFLKTTFFHELGHAIFYCNKESNEDKSIHERQANYVSSFATFGVYDDIIYRLSTIQPEFYQNPLLTWHYHFNYDSQYKTNKDKEKYEKEVITLFTGK